MTPPLVETPCLSAIVLRVEVATLDLDFPEVFRTMLDRFETFWACNLFLYSILFYFLMPTLTQLCGIPLPISVKHLEHSVTALGEGDFGGLLGFPTGLECSTTYFL